MAVAGLDHVVVNTLLDMDAAAAAFAALGFTLTPRGHHSLGSINHLMMSEGAYLELVGVPAEGLQRQEVLDSPRGLSGLVFATADADETHARLSAAGLPALEPLAFSRPVALSGREEAARFRTVRLAREAFPAGRVYFCQHLTPGLVWRPEWIAHPNGFLGIDRVVVESPQPEAEARLYARLADSRAEPLAQGWRVPLAGADIQVMAGPRPRFLTAHLLFEDLDDIERRARAHLPAEWRRHGRSAGTLALPALEVSLACRAAPTRSRS
ncbi:VOC family protein [Xanthobacter sp. AM11]|uniref:VOC family protein n=1 Tax=Xanthobacter sp. AM11 TaxID=3380643 RepID=UPI0039BF7CF6